MRRCNMASGAKRAEFLVFAICDGRRKGHVKFYCCALKYLVVALVLLTQGPKFISGHFGFRLLVCVVLDWYFDSFSALLAVGHIAW